MQLLTYETMFEYIVWPIRRIVRHVHCKKDTTLQNGLTYRDVSEYSLTLKFHYFLWCEGTINATFTLKTLLGCVYVQLLTYEDVSACISLTWSLRMHTNVQLKTRSHTRVRVFLFLRRRIYIPLLSYENHVCITYFQFTLAEKNVSTQHLSFSQTWHYKAGMTQTVADGVCIY